jgi:hypothetical protein
VLIQHFLVIQDHIQKAKRSAGGRAQSEKDDDTELTSFSSFVVQRCTVFFKTTNAKTSITGEILYNTTYRCIIFSYNFQQENEQHTHELIAKSLRIHIKQIIVPTTNHVFCFI